MKQVDSNDDEHGDCDDPLEHVAVLQDQRGEQEQVEAFAQIVVEQVEVLAERRQLFLLHLEFSD